MAEIDFNSDLGESFGTGSLTPRGTPGAMITDPAVATKQVIRMIREGVVRSLQGVDVPVKADTLCIHGDQPRAAAFAHCIRAALIADDIQIRPPARDKQKTS